MPRATTFGVSPRFSEGKLSKLQIDEMQDGVDGVHPFMARVTFYAQRFEAGDPRLDRRDFNGYQVAVYTQTREDSSFNQIGSSWAIRQYVDLDERSTPQERQKAFQFRLSCFTSFIGCKDATKML